jgi:hypothetical protein
VTAEACHNSFGIETFIKMINSLIASTDIDIDILVMLKDEVFSYPDCAYFGYLVMTRIMNSKKLEVRASGESMAQDTFLQNCLDLLRVIPFPTVDFADTGLRSTFLVMAEADGVDVDSDDGGDSDGDSEDEFDDVVTEKVKRKRERANRKSGSTGNDSDKSRKRQRLSRYEQLVNVSSYKKAFSKVWIAMMSLPGLKMAQHKIILKHLPEHVMQFLFRPILLADYLSSSFSVGGVVSVLALESLFQLILMHNIDYPKYFVALYKLCNIAVFSASYRAKFMRLLSRSLTSTNLALHVVAAFCKRLACLALQAPTPVAMFCLAQVTKLIRDHPQLIQLLHRTKGPAQDGSSGHSVLGEFDSTEEEDLEKANAISSSLWELTVLKNHHFHGVNILASALETSNSTENNSKSDLLVIEDFIQPTYATLIEAETSKAKTNSALEFQKPSSFFVGTTVGDCFGGFL